MLLWRPIKRFGEGVDLVVPLCASPARASLRIAKQQRGAHSREPVQYTVANVALHIREHSRL